MTKFSLIIPCYNEGKGLADLISRCYEVFVDYQDIEIIFVDNGSSDNTEEILRENITVSWMHSIKVEKNIGYGNGILQGLKIATGEMIGWTHADLQTDPADLLKALEIYNNSSQKNLFLKGKREGRSLIDVFFTIGMSFLETILFCKPFWDINAQPTLFPKAFFETWKNPPSDFSLDLYAYYMAHKKKLNIKRFKVHFGPRKFGHSHWNTGILARIKFIKRTLQFSFTLRTKKCF